MVRHVVSASAATPRRDAAGVPGSLPARRRGDAHDLRPAVGNLGVQHSLRSDTDAPARALHFPHQGAIRQALGVSCPLHAVLDAEGCAARGVPAYTSGAVTHFSAPNTDVHIAAHEAAHQLQHSGLSRDAGLGAEGHAHAVAEAVQQGRPARALIGDRGHRVPSAERGYEKVPSMPGSRLSETGESLTNLSHTGYATLNLIAQANGILYARRSGIQIKPGGASITLPAPDGTGPKTLTSFSISMDVDSTGNTFNSDCREAALEIMGGKGLRDVGEKAVITPGGATPATEVAPPEMLIDMVAITLYVDQRIRANPAYATLSDEDKRKFVEECRASYQWLDKQEIEALRKTALTTTEAKTLGVDQHANPGVGEAYAVFPANHATGGDFKFHFAAVIMAPGPDRVTMENDNGGPGEKSAAWRIDTYGPAEKGQSFHDAEKNFGPDRHTLRMSNQAEPPPNGEAIRRSSTPDLFPLYAASTDPKEQAYIKQELDFRSVTGTVTIVTQEDWTGNDEVILQFKAGAATAPKSIPEKGTDTVSLPASRLLPLSGTLAVSVLEYDALDPSDFIGSVAWPAPYAPVGPVTVSGDDAEYKVSLSM